MLSHKTILSVVTGAMLHRGRLALLASFAVSVACLVAGCEDEDSTVDGGQVEVSETPSDARNVPAQDTDAALDSKADGGRHVLGNGSSTDAVMDAGNDTPDATVFPGVGESCTGSCKPGFICAATGPLSRTCTANCNSDPACSLVAPGSICVGDTTLYCGRPCEGAGDCGDGTTCGSVAGRMVCTAAP